MAKPFFVFNTVDTVFDNSGLLVSSGAQVFTYQAGTTTLLTTYPTQTDATNLTNPNTNPLIADAAGRIPAIWATQACKIIVAPSNDTNPPTNPYRTRDNITGLGQTVTMKTITTTYTATASDRDMLIEVDSSGGPLTINMLSAAIAGMGFNVKYKKIDSSANTITITPNGTDQIDKSNTSVTMTTQNDYFEAYCDGTQWLVPTHNVFSSFTTTNLNLTGTLTTAGTATFNGSAVFNGTVGDVTWSPQPAGNKLMVSNGTAWIASTATFSCYTGATITRFIQGGGSNDWAQSTYGLPQTPAQGDIWYASSTTAITSLTKSASSNQFLSNSGSSNNPAWSSINFTQLAGNIATSQMNSGTAASSSTFWRGDGTWASVTSTTVVTVKRQVFTSSGTYTPSTGMLYCECMAIGGGGGGGGSATTGATTISVSGGGGGGGQSSKIFSAATIGASQTITIGAAGTAGATGTAGGNGGNTTLGALLTGGGGVGGGTIAATAGVTVLIALGGVGGSGTGGDLNMTGAPGSYGTQVLAPNGVGGCGGNGGGGYQGVGGGNGSQFTTGVTGTGYGAGGGGTSTPESQTGPSGGAGAKGAVIILEYCNQ